MQPYFDLTRKTTLNIFFEDDIKKMEDYLKKNEKLKTTYFEWRPQKNGRQPQKKLKNMEDDLKKMKKMEDDLKKMEDKPINQNQPNWLWHHCKFT